MDGRLATIARGLSAAAGHRPRVLSLFSGMEAASVAARHLGWQFVAFAEIDPAACWTLHHHYGCGRPLHLPDPATAPTAKEAQIRAARIKALAGMPEAAPGMPVNLGDMSMVDFTQFRGLVDIVVGGSPCQAFSLAGLRQSLADQRGNLSLQFVRSFHEAATPWVFAENVPGWLSTADNAFGCFLGALVGAAAPLPPPGGGTRWGSAGVVSGPLYRAAWRVLDAQGFVPQRRRRVLLVGARADLGGNPFRVLCETEAEAAGHLGERSHRGPLFPVADLGGGHPAPGEAPRAGVAGAADGGPAVADGGGVGSALSHRQQRLDRAAEAALASGVPQAYRVHAAFSTAMTSDGEARVADPVDTARSLDTSGGFATNQGGNLVVQPLDGIPETSTTLRARDCKGSPDSDCTQTLLVLPAEAVAGADRTDTNPIAFQCQGSNVGHSQEVVGTLRQGNQHVTGGVPMVAESPPEPLFLHCNKGRPAGRRSDHVAMLGLKPIVETLTTDGHGGSAVAIPTEATVFQESEFGIAEYGEAGTLRAGRIPEHQMLMVPRATIHDDPRRFDTRGIHGGGDHGELHPTLEHTNPKQIVLIDPPELEAYATETGQGFWTEREPGLRVSTAPSQPQTIVKQAGMVVRRLTPAECLALQGFPEGYLDGVRMRGKPLADGPRYKMCGNSWCVPLIAWVFARIDEEMRSL